MKALMILIDCLILEEKEHLRKYRNKVKLMTVIKIKN